MENRLEFRKKSSYYIFVLYRNHIIYNVVLFDNGMFGVFSGIYFLNSKISPLINEWKGFIEDHFREEKGSIDRFMDGIEEIEKGSIGLGLEFRKGSDSHNKSITISYKNYGIYRLDKEFRKGEMLLDLYIYTIEGRIYLCYNNITHQGVLDTIEEHFIDNNIKKIIDGVEIYG